MYLSQVNVNFLRTVRTGSHALIYDRKIELRSEKTVNAGLVGSCVHKREKSALPWYRWRPSRRKLIVWIKADVY